MRKKLVLGLMLPLCGLLWWSRRAWTTEPTSSSTARIPTTCHFGLPLKVRLASEMERDRSGDVLLTLTVTNGLGPGRYRWWLRFDPGQIEFPEGSPAWEAPLAMGETRIVQIRGRLRTTGTVRITAKFNQEPSAGKPPVEDYLSLQLLDDPLAPRSASAPEASSTGRSSTMILRDGRKARVHSLH